MPSRTGGSPGRGGSPRILGKVPFVGPGGKAFPVGLVTVPSGLLLAAGENVLDI